MHPLWPISLPDSGTQMTLISRMELATIVFVARPLPRGQDSTRNWEWSGIRNGNADSPAMRCCAMAKLCICFLPHLSRHAHSQSRIHTMLLPTFRRASCMFYRQLRSASFAMICRSRLLVSRHSTFACHMSRSLWIPLRLQYYELHASMIT